MDNTLQAALRTMAKMAAHFDDAPDDSVIFGLPNVTLTVRTCRTLGAVADEAATGSHGDSTCMACTTTRARAAQLAKDLDIAQGDAEVYRAEQEMVAFVNDLASGVAR